MNAVSSTRQCADTPAQRAFLRACELDVAVRKPGNVSRVSAGHGMQAALFSISARASLEPLFRPGARVGERVETAVSATWSAVGCNTNLGILLLCAPVARAIELAPDVRSATALRTAIQAVLADLDLRDSRAAYRAIAAAHPGGLGTAPAEDVHDEPRVGLRDAMALAAERDSIACQYRDGYAEVFELGLPRLPAGWADGFTAGDEAPPPATAAAVQHVYLTFMAHQPDSHIVRKHGVVVAHSVMQSAQAWQARAAAGADLDADPAFAAWDLALKSAGLNPGTSADLAVATLFLAGLVDAASPTP